MSTPSVAVENLSKTFGGVKAVDHVSFVLEPGSVTGLIGPNGAGKTTLLNLLTGVFAPSTGRIALAGKDMTGKRPHDMARAGVARTYQNLLLLDQDTVRDNVQIGRHRLGRKEASRSTEVVDDLLTLLDLASISEAPVSGLPYGVRRRVEIARALATDPDVLVLDEPTAGMTRDESDEIGQLIKDVASRGTTVLLVEHNVRLVTEVCQDVMVLNWGALIGRTSASEVWELEEVRAAYLGSAADWSPRA